MTRCAISPLRNALARLPSDDLPLQNHDRLVVFSTKEQGDYQQVTVEGAVGTPGDYPYSQGMRLNQLLYLAENPSKDAYTARADLYRFQADNSIVILPIDLAKTLTGAVGDDNPLLQPRDRLVIATLADKQELLQREGRWLCTQTRRIPINAGHESLGLARSRLRVDARG